MLEGNKLDTNFDIRELHYRFYLDDAQYLCYTVADEDLLEKTLYTYPVKEYSVDYDPNGNIGVVLLDKEGKFYYYYFNGQSWEIHLLYHAMVDVEIINFIDIKFSPQSPQIFFCWQDLSSPYQVSIVNYFQDIADWKKKIICRIHLKEHCKPYGLTRDHQNNLFLIFLANNNMIYDLKLSVYSIVSSHWDEAIYLASCIYIKYFFVDIVPDEKGNLYISWSDKNQSNYCIKYLRYTTSNMKKTTGIALEKKMPIPWFFITLYQDVLVIIYWVDERVYYIYGRLSLKEALLWSKEEKPIIQARPLIFTKISLDKTTQSNYNMYSDQDRKLLFNIPGLVSQEASNPLGEQERMKNLSGSSIKETIPASKIINDPLDTVEDLSKHYSNPHLKPIALEGKKKINGTLEGENRYLKEELKRLTELNRKYLSLINDGGEKIHQYKEQIHLWEVENHTLQDRITALEQKSKALEKEREKLQIDLVFLKQQNQELNEVLGQKENVIIQRKRDDEKEIGFFKKIFK